MRPTKNTRVFNVGFHKVQSITENDESSKTNAGKEEIHKIRKNFIKFILRGFRPGYIGRHGDGLDKAKAVRKYLKEISRSLDS